MSVNVINQAPYLPNTKEYPDEIFDLTTELTKSYIDIASAVNERTIGIYPVNKGAVTGNSYFLTSEKLQTIRQVYTYTAVGSIPHTIDFNNVRHIANAFSTYTDGTSFYGAIFANGTITGQVTFSIDSTNIVVVADAGAPAITFGTLVLEWISQK